MHRQLPVVLLVLLAASASGQVAELPAQVQPGSRVRVRSAGAGTIIGRVVALRDDTIRVARDRAKDTTSIAVARITTLELSVGRHKRRWSGAGIGLAAGMVLGAGVGAASYRSNSCTGDFCDVYGPWPNVVAGAVLLGSAGAITGAVLGNGTADTWSPMIGSGARVGVFPSAGRVAIGGTLRF